MRIPFVKMHAQGNDFIIVETDKIQVDDKKLSNLSRDICNRHMGLGADGLVLLNTTHPQMTVYNADGSKAEMCGSALRCCCYLIAQVTGKNDVEISTDNGVFKGIIDEHNPFNVTVEIGKPKMLKKGIVLNNYTGDYINVGNPHFVIFQSDLASLPHLTTGKSLSEDSYFKHGANVEFVRVISRDEIEMVVWERGVGSTMACGTGSMAAVFSGQQKNVLDDTVKVHVPGGEVLISKKENTFYLGGETSYIASGDFEWIV